MSRSDGEGGDASRKGISREALVAPRPRRFYKIVSVIETADGFGVSLDGRPAKTPGKVALAVRSRRLAELLAGEWAAQGKEILAETMPLTRLVNTAIDGVRGKEAAVRADIVAFSGSDLVCYRAPGPDGLVASQAQAWTPVLEWAAGSLGAHFKTVVGVMHEAQPAAAAECVAHAVADLDALRLTALHQMTTLTGSALLALACLKGAYSVEDAWRAAHVDEDWQISQWGEDAEAAERRQMRWRDMQAASRLLDLADEN